MDTIKTRRPRPKTHEAVISIRLPPALRDEIERICAHRLDRPTIAQWLREAISEKIMADEISEK